MTKLCIFLIEIYNRNSKNKVPNSPHLTVSKSRVYGSTKLHKFDSVLSLEKNEYDKIKENLELFIKGFLYRNINFIFKQINFHS